jgi:hypothetical protein
MNPFLYAERKLTKNKSRNSMGMGRRGFREAKEAAAAGFLSSERAKRSSRRESRFALFFAKAKNIGLTSNPYGSQTVGFLCRNFLGKN